jgi:hypothetical protein
VLHHLPDPQAGFDALGGCAGPGRRDRPDGLRPAWAVRRLPAAIGLRAAFEGRAGGSAEGGEGDLRASAGAGHPFRSNPHLGDHEVSDAGFYDLLLHSQDRPFTITELDATLRAAGLAMTGTPNGHFYDPAPLWATRRTCRVSPLDRMQLAEDLSGSIKLHVVYAAKAGEAEGRVAKPGPGMVPHLRGVAPQALAQAVAKTGRIPVTSALGKTHIAVPKGLAPVIARIDGRAHAGGDRAAAGRRLVRAGA